jgi:uncharacterized protein (TIGR02391 family)
MTWTHSRKDTLLMALDARALLVLADFDETSEWNRYNWFNGQRNAGLTDPDVYMALGEAWQWLISKGLVAHNPLDGSEAVFITERGREALALGFSRLRAAERLGVDLHPALAAAIRRQFLLGEYELAAFAAMREVEVRTRELAEASHSDIGTKLMQRAFEPGGPLADPDQDPGERVATMELFKGAIGVFKNPSSHRVVDYSDPTLAS